MAALTATILDEEAPRARVAVLLKHFSQLGDDREPWRVMYPLKEGMLLIVCATIAGCARCSIVSIRSCLDAALRVGWRRYGRSGTTSSPSTARPHGAPTTAAKG